ncbi:MAG: DUF4384 domain-containing protein [Deinococcales bacterium]
MMLLGAVAWADELEHFVAPTNPEAPFAMNVFVDKDPSGDLSPVYNIGEGIRLGVTVSQDSYIYLFNVRATGEITQILPNTLDEANFVRAGESKYFPSLEARYSFSVTGPTGLDKLIAIASKVKLDTSNIVQFQQGDSYFARSEQDASAFSQSLSIVINPLGAEAWVTDVALFYVADGLSDMSALLAQQAAQTQTAQVAAQPNEVNPSSDPPTSVPQASQPVAPLPASQEPPPSNVAPINLVGQLFVQSNIGYADVYVDGQHVGQIAPVSGQFLLENITIGSHILRLSAPGFIDAETSFVIENSQMTRVNLTQTRLP